jgi:type III secretion protein C
VLVVPLKFAFAADRMSGSTRLAGLATTLNNLYGGGESAGGIGGNAVETMQAAVGSLLGTAPKQRTALETFGFKSASPTSPATVPRPPENKLADGASRDAPPPADKPYFQADEATNSIIVRGRSERLSQYEALIGKLDVAQDLIEIEATIIDVSSDEFESLGIEWDFTGSRSRLTVSPGQSGGPGASTASALGGTNITTLLSNAGRQLLTRIRALEGSGKARIVSRPKVLGAANRTATMIDKRVASVRVSGNLDANLFTVEAGTTLQVQPQIVNHPDRRDVRLTLYIQDGNFEGTVVDEVPIIKRTEITSDMSIPEGDSLLIGGISTESDVYGRSGVWGLGRLPLIGALFRNTERSKFRSERLFLLTPKIISVAGATPMPPGVPNGLPATRPVPGSLAPAPGLPQPAAPAPSAPASAAPVSLYGPDPYGRGAQPVGKLAASEAKPVCVATALGLAEPQCGPSMPAQR